MVKIMEKLGKGERLYIIQNKEIILPTLCLLLMALLYKEKLFLEGIGSQLCCVIYATEPFSSGSDQS